MTLDSIWLMAGEKLLPSFTLRSQMQFLVGQEFTRKKPQAIREQIEVWHDRSQSEQIYYLVDTCYGNTSIILTSNRALSIGWRFSPIW
ncbi:MAG: hypothetical protein WD037_10250 [Balneolales bacterium]